MIELKDVSKSYKTNKGEINALRSINIKINQGEIFGIIGESGAGKSTLVRTINFLEKPDSGLVLFENIPLNNLSLSELREVRKQIGMIFQGFNLLSSRTVFENIALPLEFSGYPKSEITKKVNSLIELVGLTSRENCYISKLSGGQKQRVAIARALTTSPKVLLCDESTSALDIKSTKSILELLKDINKKLNVTIILITHEVEVLKSICNRVALIEQGEIKECQDILSFITKPKSINGIDFINNMLNSDLPDFLGKPKAQLGCSHGSQLIRVTFQGDRTEKPLVSDISKNFDVTFNILKANIESIQGRAIGTMLVRLHGNAIELRNAIQYIKSQGQLIEELGYV